MRLDTRDKAEVGAMVVRQMRRANAEGLEGKQTERVIGMLQMLMTMGISFSIGYDKNTGRYCRFAIEKYTYTI